MQLIGALTLTKPYKNSETLILIIISELFSFLGILATGKEYSCYMELSEDD